MAERNFQLAERESYVNYSLDSFAWASETGNELTSISLFPSDFDLSWPCLVCLVNPPKAPLSIGNLTSSDLLVKMASLAQRFVLIDGVRVL